MRTILEKPGGKSGLEKNPRRLLDKNTVMSIQRSGSGGTARTRGRCQVATLIETNQGVKRRTWIGIMFRSVSRAASVSSSGKWPETGRPPAAMETRRVPLR
ncbi:hypothetical protein D9M68_986680 [compost metagenome]